MEFKWHRGKSPDKFESTLYRLRHGAGRVEDLEFALATLGSKPSVIAIRGLMRVVGEPLESIAKRRRYEVKSALNYYAEVKYGKTYGTISAAPDLIAMTDVMQKRGFFGTLDLNATDKTRDQVVANYMGVVDRLAKEGILALGNDDPEGLPLHVTQTIYALRQFVDDQAEVQDGSYYPHRDPRAWQWLAHPEGLAQHEAEINRRLTERSYRQPTYDVYYGDALLRPATIGTKYYEAATSNPPDFDMVGTMYAAASQFVNYPKEQGLEGAFMNAATDPNVTDLLEDYVADGLPLLMRPRPPLWLAQVAVDQLRDDRRPSERKTAPIFTDRGAPTEEDLARVGYAVARGVACYLGPGASGYRLGSDEFLLSAEYWLRLVASRNNLLGEREKQELRQISDRRILKLFDDGLVDKRRASSRFQLPEWIERDLKRLRGV